MMRNPKNEIRKEEGRFFLSDFVFRISDFGITWGPLFGRGVVG
jgi:hypothetical protein